MPTISKASPFPDRLKPAAVDKAGIAAAGVALALLLALAWPMLTWWAWEYTRPDSYYNHAPLVPLLSLAMLGYRRADLRAARIRPFPPALFLFVPALALLVLALKAQMEAVESTSFLLCLLSGAWFLMGSLWMRIAAFPLLFLWLMAPLPGPVLNDATLGMQTLSTHLAGGMLHLLGFSVQRFGTLLTLEDYTLNVDVPCSGFKMLLRLLTFSLAFAYFTEMSKGKRVGLFLLSLPLSLLINALRIALIGIVGECIGATSAHTFHDWSGLITTILCLVLLLMIARGMGCRRFAGQPIF